VLIGATTRDPDAIDAAIRSRCAAVYFEPLTRTQVARIVREAAQRLGREGEPARFGPDRVVHDRGRKAVQILADAFGHALERSGSARGASVREEDVLEVVQAGRIVQHTTTRARRVKEIGKAHGLGVLQYVGSIVEIEAAAFPAREPRKGTVRFNDTAARWLATRSSTRHRLIRAVTGTDPADWDLHVNVVGGGNIDGPSAGLAFFLALHSALAHIPLPQDVAVTGEVSLAGNVARGRRRGGEIVCRTTGGDAGHRDPARECQ